MHVVISWDISNKSKWDELNEKLKACIANHSWVKPLTTLYVVKVVSIQDRDAVVAQLTEVARQNPNDVNVICSPLMSGGTYHGWLPQNLWAEINSRTA
jgi:hypothetical protein